MKVEVQLFAVAKDAAGQDRIELELPDSATVAEVRIALAEAAPGLAPLLPSMAFAINAEYAKDEAPIPPGAEIACIPPVSGG